LWPPPRANACTPSFCDLSGERNSMEAHPSDVASALIVCFASLHVSRFGLRENEISRECVDPLSDSNRMRRAEMAGQTA
jgi:hypothetical protein